MERTHCAGINGRNATHTDDNNLRMMVTVDIKNLVCCGEKHRTADFKNTDGMRDVTQFSASPGVMSGESVYFHALISAVSAIRFIKSRAANTTPISMATTRSKNTVKKKVATRTMMSLLGAILQRRKKEDQSARYRYNIKGCKEH